MRLQSDLGQRHARRFPQADQLRRLGFDALFQADAGSWRRRLRRLAMGYRGGRLGIWGDIGTKVPYQRRQSAVESLPDRHEAPAPSLR